MIAKLKIPAVDIESMGSGLWVSKKFPALLSHLTFEEVSSLLPLHSSHPHSWSSCKCLWSHTGIGRLALRVCSAKEKETNKKSDIFFRKKINAISICNLRYFCQQIILLTLTKILFCRIILFKGKYRMVIFFLCFKIFQKEGFPKNKN